MISLNAEALAARLRAVADGLVADPRGAAGNALVVEMIRVSGELVDEAFDRAIETIEDAADVAPEDEPHVRALYGDIPDELGELAHGVALVLGVDVGPTCESRRADADAADADAADAAANADADAAGDDE